MGKLEEIFKIAEPGARQKALLDYARSNKVNVGRARNPGGDYNEDELAVLIYDMEQSGKLEKTKKMGLAVGAIIILVVFAAMMFILQKMLASF